MIRSPDILQMAGTKRQVIEPNISLYDQEIYEVERIVGIKETVVSDFQLVRSFTEI